MNIYIYRRLYKQSLAVIIHIPIRLTLNQRTIWHRKSLGVTSHLIQRQRYSKHVTAASSVRTGGNAPVQTSAKLSSNTLH